MWETSDYGRTWAPRTDDQPSLGIGAIAFDPSDPTKLYAGTGEGNTLEVPGQGLLRSTDGGTSWALTAEDTFAGGFFYQLIVDPDHGHVLFAATNNGTFRSTNSGSTWTQLRAAPTWAISLEYGGQHPPEDRELLAACTDGLYRSADQGASWHLVTLPGAPASFANTIARMAVAHAPSNGAVAYAFAAKEGSVWLWRRTVAGGDFAEVQLPSLDPPNSPPGNGITQSWYDWCLAAAPDDPDTVFVGAIELFRGQRATSGTWSWQDISSRARGDSIHPDQHTIVFDPGDPQVVYAGNDGGIFRSPDRGNSWQSLNKGLGIAEFEYLAQHSRNRTWIIGGTQDNGTLRHRRGDIWDQIALGDGGDCAVERATPGTCYHSYYGMAMDRSRNAGDRWTDVTPPVPDNYKSLFYPPLEANGATVARAGESVFVSDDEGATWTEIGLPAGKAASAMTFASDTRLLVGRADGRIFSLDRRSSGWDAAQELSAPRSAYLSDLLAHPASPHQYWATYSAVRGGHVYRSDDGGVTWADVTSNLPDVPVNAIETDPQAEHTAWIATDVGVFQSTNRGRSWAILGDGLPRALAVDLVYHDRLRLLRVGTRSRGVWEINVS